MKKVSVIIPSFNGKHFLDKCLGSLKQGSFTDFGIILCDNGSSDGTAEYMRAFHPDVTFIENGENLGFAAAVNIGIRASESEYVVLLNNDTECDPDFLQNLVNAMDVSPNAFSGSAKMLMLSDTSLTDDAGDLYTIFGLAFQRGNRKKESRYNAPAKITASCGGACIYRRSFLSETGLLDDAFFAYREDLDLGIRAKLLGYDNIFVPDARVIHYGSGTANRSGKRYNAFKTRLSARNLVYVNHKNFPFLMHLVNLPFILTGIIAKTLFFIPKRLAGCYISAVFEGLTSLRKVKRVHFGPKHIGNCIRFEWELIVNCFRIF